MFKQKQPRELKIAIKTPRRGASDSVRVAAAIVRAVSQAEGYISSDIFGGSRGHDMIVKACFKSMEAIKQVKPVLEQAILVEEARGRLNCEFRINAGLIEDFQAIGREPIYLNPKLTNWHGLGLQAKLEAIDEICPTLSARRVNVEIEIDEQEKNLWIEGIGELDPKYLEMVLEHTCNRIKGFMRFQKRHQGHLVYTIVFGSTQATSRLDQIADLISKVKGGQMRVCYQVTPDFEYVYNIPCKRCASVCDIHKISILAA